MVVLAKMAGWEVRQTRWRVQYRPGERYWWPRVGLWWWRWRGVDGFQKVRDRLGQGERKGLGSRMERAALWSNDEHWKVEQALGKGHAVQVLVDRAWRDGEASYGVKELTVQWEVDCSALVGSYFRGFLPWRNQYTSNRPSFEQRPLELRSAGGLWKPRGLAPFCFLLPVLEGYVKDGWISPKFCPVLTEIDECRF